MQLGLNLVSSLVKILENFGSATDEYQDALSKSSLRALVEVNF